MPRHPMSDEELARLEEMGCGSGMTCWRRLQDWQRAGVWKGMHRALLQQLQDAGQIAWARAARDSARVPAPAGGEATGKDPTNRGKLGTKRHVVVDRHGLPLAVTISASNVHDLLMLEAAIDAVPPLRLPGRQRERPPQRPTKLHADKGYDFKRCRQALHRRGIILRIARCGVDSSEQLGRFRWVAERTLSWLNRFRRPNVRYERRGDIHQAFLTLGCSLICWQASNR